MLTPETAHSGGRNRGTEWRRRKPALDQDDDHDHHHASADDDNKNKNKNNELVGQARKAEEGKFTVDSSSASATLEHAVIKREWESQAQIIRQLRAALRDVQPRLRALEEERERVEGEKEALEMQVRAALRRRRGCRQSCSRQTLRQLLVETDGLTIEWKR
jgi:hypothetical protein